MPIGDVSARSFQLRLKLDSSAALLPGTSASATFYFQGTGDAVYVVPPDALLRHADGKFSVFTVRDNRASRHSVTVGRSSEDGVEITGGLPADAPVVIRGNEILKDGQTGRVIGEVS